MEYKGCIGKAKFDEEEGILHGEVINLRDVITFEGESVEEIEKAFRESIDDYLAFCSERGEEPEKPYSGKFIVRIPPELHREASIQAKLANKSLNHWLTDIVNHALHS